MSLIAMEKPASFGDEDIRTEKARLLRAVREVGEEDVVLGQYTGDYKTKKEEAKVGYSDDGKVPHGSKTPTYAAAVLHVDNDRWENVKIYV